MLVCISAAICGCAAKNPTQIPSELEKTHPHQLVIAENKKIATLNIRDWKCNIHYGPGAEWEAEIVKRAVMDAWVSLIDLFQVSENGTLDIYIVSKSDWARLPVPYSMLGGMPYSLIGKATLVLPSRELPRDTFYGLWKSVGYIPKENLSDKQFYSNFVTPLLIHELAHLVVADAFKQKEDDLGFSLGLNETMANIGLALATKRQSHHWPFYLSVHKELLKTAIQKAKSPLAILIKQPFEEGPAIYSLFQGMSLDFVDKLCQEIRPDELVHIFGLLKGSDRKTLDKKFASLISAASNKLRDEKFLIAISERHEK